MSRDAFVTRSRDRPGVVCRGMRSARRALINSFISERGGSAGGTELEGVTKLEGVTGTVGCARLKWPGTKLAHGALCAQEVVQGSFDPWAAHPRVTLPLAALQFQQTPGNLAVEKASSLSRALVLSLQKELRAVLGFAAGPSTAFRNEKDCECWESHLERGSFGVSGTGWN